jgi:hypothetical protein
MGKLGTGALLGIVGTGLSIGAMIANFVGGKIGNREKEEREIAALDAKNEERFNKWIAEREANN